MKVLVIGSTGKIGSLLVPLLIEEGHEVVAALRDEGKGKVLQEKGAHLHSLDLESSIAPAFSGVDACVFTAGSGGATGKDKTLLVDLWGAIKTIRACEERGVSRYIMISALRAHDPDCAQEGIRPYLAAKHGADEILRHSKLDFTILRPGRLTDEAPSGKIRVGPGLAHDSGEIARGNVALAVCECLRQKSTVGRIIEVLDGEIPVADALAG